MQDQRISTPAELAGALRARELQRRAELKKVATGRSFRGAEVVGVVCSLLLVVAGVGAYFDSGDGVLQIALGFALTASFLWNHHQRQLAALVELVARLEDDCRASRKPAS